MSRSYPKNVICSMHYLKNNIYAKRSNKTELEKATDILKKPQSKKNIPKKEKPLNRKENCQKMKNL
jgi:hypothetical protein